MTELRYLASNAAYYFHHLRLLSAQWKAADTKLREMGGRLPYDRPRPSQNALAEQTALLVNAQSETFASIDALLAVVGRIAMILFESEKSKGIVKRRAGYLRRVLKVAPGGVLEDKRLRNAWTHFDERLDMLPDGLQSDLFTTLAELDSQPKPKAVRHFAVDGLVVEFFGEGRFELDAIEAAVSGLGNAVDGAISTWGERRHNFVEEVEEGPEVRPAVEPTEAPASDPPAGAP